MFNLSIKDNEKTLKNDVSGVSPGVHSILGFLAQNAKDFPKKIAMREKDLGIWQEYTWEDYYMEVLAFAAGIEGLGFKYGDALLILGDNRPQLYFGMLGVAMLGGFPTPVFPDSTPREILHLAKDSGARFALAEDQEQVDKVLDLRDQLGHLDFIIYKDPRGLSSYEEPELISYREVRAKGLERLREEEGLEHSLLNRTGLDDYTIFLHSSGTTGEPKSILLKHRHLISAMQIAKEGGIFKQGEEILAYLPMAWVGDFVYTVAGGIVFQFAVNIPESQETVLQDLRETAPSLIFAPPRLWENMQTNIQVRMESSSLLKKFLYKYFVDMAVEMERKKLQGEPLSLWQKCNYILGNMIIYSSIRDHLGLSKVQRAYTGGEAMGEDTFLFFRAIGVNLKQGYGLTEVCAFTTMQPDTAVKPHTAGKPLPGINLRISREGEILIKGKTVFDGYYNNPEATARSLTDGWFKTGDTGYFEDDGQLVVLGRISEVMYTSRGEMYVPNYIENRLKFSPYIKDAAVIGAGRPYLSAIICIEMEAVGNWAELNGISYTSYADLCQKSVVYELIAKAISHVNEFLPPHLRIRRFINLHKEFDPDDGELTRTRKLRRKVVEERYQDLIDAIYGGLNSIEVQATIVYETGETGFIKRKLAIEEVK